MRRVELASGATKPPRASIIALAYIGATIMNSPALASPSASSALRVGHSATASLTNGSLEAFRLLGVAFFTRSRRTASSAKLRALVERVEARVDQLGVDLGALLHAEEGASHGRSAGGRAAAFCSASGTPGDRAWRRTGG
jgi:hypothetical protein